MVNNEHKKGKRKMKKLATIITLFLGIGCENILAQGISFIAFIIQLICNTVFGRWNERTWYLWFERYTLPLYLLYGAVTTVWFTWGSIRDLFRLFKTLANRKIDDSDNGSVEISND